jgi:hypothetical protein
MNTQKNALLLFAKPPVAGMVKTRLTTEHDGPFTPLQAATLFRRMMFDVLECAMQGLDILEEQNRAAREADPQVPEQTYEVFVSTTPASSVEKMKEVFAESGEWPRPITFIQDSGKVFDDHFDDAFQQIFDRGFGTCLAMGGDIPIMPRQHVVDAFNWLHTYQQRYPEGGVVLAPCQASGTSIVGYTPECGMNHQTVYYNNTGRPALQAYLDKASELGGVHVALLDSVPDVDNMEDFAHVITVINALEYVGEDQDMFVPHRTLEFIRAMGLQVTTPPNRNFDNRDAIDL